jgi:dihydroorotase
VKTKQLPKSVKITNCTILDPFAEKEFAGEILLKNGKINDVGKSISADGVDELDANGAVVTHGFCDIHAHFREPGREDKETLVTGSRAALAGGFTTVCVMPNTNPPLDSPESIRFIAEKAEDLSIQLYPIGAVTVGQNGKEMTEMGEMVKAGAVAFSDDGIPIIDGEVMRLALEYSTQFDVPIINHAEDVDLRGSGQMNEGRWSTRLGLAGIPDISESIMVERDLQVAGFTGGRIHVPHVSTEKSVHAIRRAKKNGVNISAEVTPHHLYFDDSALQTYDTNLKVAPPIRSEADREAMIGAISDGTVNCIATDHAPHTVEEKESPFEYAPCGMIGLESAFGAVWKMLSDKKMSLLDVVRKLTVMPRQIIGFDSDLFAKGAEAELVFLNPDQEWTFGLEHIRSKSRNSPFVGEMLKGQVVSVVSRGQIISFK